MVPHMPLIYNARQHKEYLKMTDKIGEEWIRIFDGRKKFYSTAYWDLFTTIWRNNGELTKTDALDSMKGLKSAVTASKCVEASKREGFIVEVDNPDDARSKLVRLSPSMNDQLNAFFDEVIGELRRANRLIDEIGPSPREL